MWGKLACIRAIYKQSWFLIVGGAKSITNSNMRHKTNIEIPDPFPYRRRIVAKALAKSTMNGVVYRLDISPDELNLHVINGRANAITATVKECGDKLSAHVDSFMVHPGMQGHGIGTGLLKGLVVVAESYGAEELWSVSVSSQALAVRGKVFGKQAMRYYDSWRDEPDFLDINYDEAMKVARSLDRIQEVESDKLAAIGCLGVYIDFDDIETDDWHDQYSNIKIENLGTLTEED